MPEWGKAEFDQFYRLFGERWGHPASRSPVMLHYHWFSIVRHQRSKYAPLLASLLGLQAGDAVVLVGCGWNGTGAGLEDLGIRVVGTETSNYVLGEKGNTEEAELRALCTAVGVDPDANSIIGPPGNVMVNPLDLWLEGGRASPAQRGKGTIMDENLSTNGSKRSILREFDRKWPGVTPNWIITEEVLNSIPDNEAGLVIDYCASGAADWGATVAHMLSPRQDDKVQAPELNWKYYSEWRTLLDTNGYGSQAIVPTVTADDPVLGRVEAYSGLI